MSRIFSSGAVLALACCCAPHAAANPVLPPGYGGSSAQPQSGPAVPLPVRRPGPLSHRLVVEGSRGASHAVLRLPRSLVQQNPILPIAPAAAGASLPGEAALPARTVVLGVALSVCLGLVGLWLARQRRRLALGGLGLVLVGGLMGVSCVHTDPPVEAPLPPAPLTLTADGKLAGEALLEWAEGDEVRLVVHPETMSPFIIRTGLKTELEP